MWVGIKGRGGEEGGEVGGEEREGGGGDVEVGKRKGGVS